MECDTMESHNLSYEPMDIDLSSHSVKEMDISYNDSLDVNKIKLESHDVFNEVIQQNSKINRIDCQPVAAIKKYHINIQKPIKGYKNYVFQTIWYGIVILLSIVTFYIYNLKCCDDFNLLELRENLSGRLFGQTEAINVILKTLESKESSKLLFFSGGTGVGKTFTSSVLLETIGPCSNVYHYTMPSFTSTFSTDFMFGLTMCRMSLIIVDDLTTEDMHIKKQIKEVIKKSQQLGKDITVILIYNCNESTQEFLKQCDTSFDQRLMANFAEIKTLKSIVEFKSLSEENLKECIKQELGNRELKDFSEVLKNFNVTVDGCKGVHSKMKYLNIL